MNKQYKFEGKFVFGFIGTFGFWHGIDVLEKLIPAFIEKTEYGHFLLIGDGVLKEGFEKKMQELGLSEHVTFTGKIMQDKAPEYLAICDVFLCPTQPNADGTRFFGSPTKLFEYMSMAKPIIASDLEQLSQVLNPAVRAKDIHEQGCPQVTNQVGFLVDPWDVRGFVDTALACMQMPKEGRIKMGMNARKKVLEQYTWQQHVQRIIDHAGL